MRLGSLFDGSGTAPLAASMCGIDPVWASEIEPYPIKVTTARFPGMKHLGSITDINGAEVIPVDIICGGSPCQDLSVAGKQAGLHNGERSHLFFEMTRIIKEMRGATNGKYPRFVIWENVPGAFSSNKGRDFLAVLQAFAEIADPDVYVPEPPSKSGRLAWRYAGEIVGDGWSIAWRTVDAQYWGVPQRRRRIYLVADLGRERAGEVLFEREGMPRNPEPSRTPRKETAACVGSGIDGSNRHIMLFEPRSMLHENWAESVVKNALRAGESKSAHAVVFAIEGNTIDRASSKNGKGYCENVSPTLNTQDRHGIVMAFDCRNMALREETSNTLQAKSGGGYSLNYQNPIMYPFDMQAFGKYGDGRTASSCKARDYKGATDLVVISPTQSFKYIIRRLTPLECCRLQGFPDWYEDGVVGSDSARYKMWGNGMALPNILFVMQNIARAMAEQWAGRCEA